VRPNWACQPNPPFEFAVARATVARFHATRDLCTAVARRSGAVLPASKIFEELPLKIKNSFLITALLREIEESRNEADTDFSAIDEFGGTAYAVRHRWGAGVFLCNSERNRLAGA
jgi:hypothetical protein